jgi:hypothetical protein
MRPLERPTRRADRCDVGADIGHPFQPLASAGAFFHRGEQFCTDAALKFGLGGESLLSG